MIVSMASPEAFSGYWQRPDADAKAIRDGWYYTGDLAMADDDGDLWVSGRVDDMINSGGENIYPDEIEAALVRCPAIDDVCVVGLPDERWGHAVTAFVVPGRGADPLGAAEQAAGVRPRGAALAQAPEAGGRGRRPSRAPAVGKTLRRKLVDGEFEPGERPVPENGRLDGRDLDATLDAVADRGRAAGQRQGQVPRRPRPAAGHAGRGRRALHPAARPARLGGPDPGPRTPRRGRGGRAGRGAGGAAPVPAVHRRRDALPARPAWTRCGSSASRSPSSSRATDTPPRTPPSWSRWTTSRSTPWSAPAPRSRRTRRYCTRTPGRTSRPTGRSRSAAWRTCSPPPRTSWRGSTSSRATRRCRWSATRSSRQWNDEEDGPGVEAWANFHGPFTMVPVMAGALGDADVEGPAARARRHRRQLRDQGRDLPVRGADGAGLQALRHAGALERGPGRAPAGQLQRRGPGDALRRGRRRRGRGDRAEGRPGGQRRRLPAPAGALHALPLLRQRHRSLPDRCGGDPRPRGGHQRDAHRAQPRLRRPAALLRPGTTDGRRRRSDRAGRAGGPAAQPRRRVPVRDAHRRGLRLRRLRRGRRPGRQERRPGRAAGAGRRPPAPTARTTASASGWSPTRPARTSATSAWRPRPSSASRAGTSRARPSTSGCRWTCRAGSR